MGANSLNLIRLKSGDIVRMTDGSKVKIVQNPGDGLWVYGFYLNDEATTDFDGVEQPIFAQEIEELLSTGG